MAHFSFRTLLNNETYGTGFFEYPDPLGTEPGTTVYQNSITAFAYSDPDVGSFDLSNLNTFHFTIATTPTTCAFNIIMSTADRLKSVTAGPAQPGLLGPTSGKPIKLEWPSQAQATPTPIPIPTPAPTPTPAPAHLGMFLIRSRLNGFVIDITDSNTAPSTQLISCPINSEKGTSNQRWHLIPTVGGASLIQSALNNFAIDITDSNTAPKTPVIAYPANSAEGTSNQQWELIPVSGLENVYLIRSKLNGFVLDIEDGNPSPCARIISYPINGEIGTPNQHWELVSVDVIDQPEPAPAPLPKPDDPDIIITAIADVYMSNLLYKGQVKRTQSDEYVELTNRGNKAADISDWKITSAGSAKQWFIFPADSILDAGKSFRVYTNEVHPETGGFSFGSKTAIWNDVGDELNLFDATAKKVATLTYGKARKK